MTSCAKMLSRREELLVDLVDELQGGQLARLRMQAAQLGVERAERDTIHALCHALNAKRKAIKARYDAKLKQRDAQIAFLDAQIACKHRTHVQLRSESVRLRQELFERQGFGFFDV